jgi:hypothetical protein
MRALNEKTSAQGFRANKARAVVLIKIGIDRRRALKHHRAWPGSVSVQC